MSNKKITKSIVNVEAETPIAVEAISNTGGRPANNKMDGMETVTINPANKEATIMKTTTIYTDGNGQFIVMDGKAVYIDQVFEGNDGLFVLVNGEVVSVEYSIAQAAGSVEEAVDGIVDECYAQAVDKDKEVEAMADLLESFNGIDAKALSIAELEIAKAEAAPVFEFIMNNGTPSQAALVEEALLSGDFAKLQESVRTVINKIVAAAPVAKRASLMSAAAALVTPLFTLTKKAIMFSWSVISGIGKAVFNVLKWTFVHVKELIVGLGIFGKDVFVEVGTATMDILKFAFGRYSEASRNIGTSFGTNVKPAAVAFGTDMSSATAQLMEDLSFRMTEKAKA